MGRERTYHIKQYPLEKGALEIQYIEEFFGEFDRKKTAVDFHGRRVLYGWIGGTRSDWRGQGHFRALTEQQESWALEHGFKEIVVKTKNKFYGMRATLTHLSFDVIKYERNLLANRESKVYVSKRIGPEVLSKHQSERTLFQAV